jgi:hypothetical protein
MVGAWQPPDKGTDLHVDEKREVDRPVPQLMKQLSSDHDLVLKTFRLLISDICQNFNGGHPGYVQNSLKADSTKETFKQGVRLEWPL